MLVNIAFFWIMRQWQAVELTYFRDEHLERDIAQKRARVAEDYKAIFGQLRAKYPGRFERYSEELYLWSRTIVETRYFWLPDLGSQDADEDSPFADYYYPTHVMLPLADLLNHAPGNDNGCASSNHTHAKEHRDDEQEAARQPRLSDVQVVVPANQELVMLAARTFGAGEEATFCYLPDSNRELLEMYGFALPENPFDEVEVPNFTSSQNV